MSRASLGWTLLVPIATSLVVVAMGQARGPNWLGFNWDPGYPYLLNALNILEGDHPRHTDHPGTPVQLLAASGIWVAHALSRQGGTVRSYVLHHPEFLLALLNSCLIAIYAVTAALLGRAAHRLSGSMACAVYSQVAPSLALVSLHAASWFSPQPVLMIIATGVAVVALRYLGVEPSLAGVRYAVAIGLLSGVGVAAKVTFIPAAIAGLLIVRGLRDRAVGVSCAVAAFLLSVLPILPVARRTFDWFVRVALHSGRYGTGDATLIDVDQYPANVWTLTWAEPAFFVLLATSAALLIPLRLAVERQRVSQQVRRWWSALAVVVAAQLLQVVLVAKDPQSGYLVPAINLSSLTVCLLFSVCVATWPRWRQAFVLGFLMAFLIAAGYQARVTIRLLSSLERTKAEQLSVYSFAHGFEGAQIVVFYGSTSPAYALSAGNEWAGLRYSRDLRELFPRAVFYSLRTGRFVAFGGEPVPAAQVADWLHDGRLLFQGPRSLLPRTFDYDVLKDTEVEGVFRARAR